MTALARKWRPKTFNEYKGQDHVIKSLKHAISNERLHHAYLFSGTRGVGKTSVARLLAKALSCKQGISENPCQKCEHCQAINSNNYIDLIEVDAASKTKVEDTRELLEHAQFMPHSGKFKIFIIDEVHMLSNHSFNALLKTLEEPPEHVKFFLATTDPEKLPITVVSRCLHFQLLPLDNNQISEHIQQILDQEQINYDHEAINQIAEHAQGSIRDALSCTDQLIALGGGSINSEAVATLLGLAAPSLIAELFNEIITNNRAKALEIIANMYKQGINLKKVLLKLMELIYNRLNELVLAKAPAKDKEIMHYYYQIAAMALRDFEYNPSSLIALNMMVMRMLDFSYNKEGSEKTSNTNTQKTRNLLDNEGNILDQLELSGMTKAIAKTLAISKHDQDEIILKISDDKKALLTPIHIKKIKDAIVKTGYSGEVIIASSPKSSDNSQLSKAFNGQILSSSDRK